MDKKNTENTINLIYDYCDPLTKEEARKLFKDGEIPDHQFSKTYAYTRGNPHLINYFVDNYNKREDSFAKLKNYVMNWYELNYTFDSPAHLNLLAACCRLSRISFSLFANLAVHYKLSAFELNASCREGKLLYEDNGYYRFYPYYHEFLQKKVEQYFGTESLEKTRKLLVSLLVGEKNFHVEYLKLAATKLEKQAMENRMVEMILSRGWDFWDNDLLLVSPEELENSGLKLLLMLSRDFPFNEISIRYLLEDLKNDPLCSLLQAQHCYYLGRNLRSRNGAESPPSLEDDYLKIIESWLKGEKPSVSLEHEFFLRYGFMDVPDFLIYRIDENKLLRENEYRKWTFHGRLTVLYNYYLKGEYDKAQKLFYLLLKTYKAFFLQGNREVYYFILGHHFYSRNKLQKAKWFLEEALIMMEHKGRKIFVLKLLNTYLRILFEEKDTAGLIKLLERSKLMLTREKPFVLFLQYLKGCIKILNGEKLRGDLDGSIQYSIEIGDEVSAVQYFSYSLNKSDQAGNSLLRVQEGLLDKDQIAIYQNTSIIDMYRKVQFDFNFFGPLKATILQTDLSANLISRKKLRKILSYIVYYHPNKVSREEIKRIFWDSDKSYDIDANLRVAISNLKKIFKAHGYEDLFVCKDASICINERYTVNNDFRKYVSLYKKAKLLYRNQDFINAEGYLRKIVQLNLENIFMDISWDYLENRVRQQAKLIVMGSYEILLELAKRDKDLERAEEYCRRLFEHDPKYIRELADLLIRMGREEEARKLLRSHEKSSKSLETIFFPD